MTEIATFRGEGLGNASYLVDLGDGRGLVLDPSRDPAAYLADELPAGPVTVMCGHGERAMTGSSPLQRAGRGDVTVLLGSPSDWSRATRRPLESS